MKKMTAPLILVLLLGACDVVAPLDQAGNRGSLPSSYMSSEGIDAWVKKYLTENLVPEAQIDAIRAEMKSTGLLATDFDSALLGEDATDEKMLVLALESFVSAVLAGEFPNKIFLLSLSPAMMVRYFTLKSEGRSNDDVADLVKALALELANKLEGDEDMAAAVFEAATGDLSRAVAETHGSVASSGQVSAAVMKGVIDGIGSNTRIAGGVAGAAVEFSGSNIDIIKKAFTALLKAAISESVANNGGKAVDDSTMQSMIIQIVEATLRNLGVKGDDIVATLKKIAANIIADFVSQKLIVPSAGQKIGEDIANIDVSSNSGSSGSGGSSSVPPPGAFTITSPAGTQFNSTVTVAFSSSTGADNYDVVIASNSNCSSVVAEKKAQASTSVAFTGLANGTYYICATANNESSTSTDASNTGLSFAVASERFYTMYSTQDTGDDLILRHFDGSAWSAETVVENNSYVRPVVAFTVTGGGQIHYLSRDSTNDRVYYNNQSAGSFVGEVQIQKLTNFVNGSLLDIAVDSANDFMAGIVRVVPGSPATPTLYSLVGTRSSFTQPVVESSALGGYGFELAAAVDKNDNKFLAVFDYYNAVQLFKDTGSGWDAGTALPLGVCNGGGLTSLDLTTDDTAGEGKIHAVGICENASNTCTSLYITNRTGSFVVSEIFEIGGACPSGTKASIYLDASGEPHTVFKDGSHQLWYTAYDGSNWSAINMPIVDGPAYYPRIAIGSNGLIVVSYWTAAVPGASSLGAAYNGGGGWVVTTPVTTSNNVRALAKLKATGTRGSSNFP